jgi:cystathionine beta-lyase
MGERNLDFDKVINRKNTKCLKYDFAVKRGYPEDVLPLWVADMDFKTSSYIEDAIKEVASHNIYGYTNTQHNDGFFEAVAGWMKRHHGWNVEEEWYVKTPGVCFAIATAIRAYTEKGDAVIIQQPVYYPFAGIIKQNGRRMVSSDLIKDEAGNYSIDFGDFERKIIENKVKLFILCNPHNPTGRVWSREELITLGNICLKYEVKVFSDEIHFDFIWKGEHNIFQETEGAFKDITITATAPSKTFNLAGLQQSNIFIPDQGLRKSFIRTFDATGYDEPNIFGIAAAEAAYRYGDEWYEKVTEYIRRNIEFTYEYVRENLPFVKMSETQGTYLVWLDFNGTGFDPKKIDDIICNKAKLWLDSGRIFGDSGAGFERINVACPKSVLYTALERIKRAFES